MEISKFWFWLLYIDTNFFLFYKGIKVEKLFMSINISLQGSRDNMSIIIIAFPGAPKVDPEAVRKEDELNKLIKQKVTG